MGKEFLKYYHDEKKVCYVDEDDLPDYEYSHDDWEDKYLQNINSTPMSPQSPAEKKGRTTEQCVKQKSKPPIRCLFPDSCSKPHAKPAHIHVSHSPNISATSNTVQAPLKRCMSQTATRQELSQTKLPPVTTLIQEKDIVPIYGGFQEDNPYMVKSRPSESITEVAHKVMNSSSIQMIKGNTIELDDSNGPSGVRIGNLGNFNNSGIQVLLKYCSIAKLQHDYKEEMAWLSVNPDKQSLTDPEINYLVRIFESSPHDPLHVVATLDGHHVDFKSLSTLVGERYIDNFVINFCLRKTFLLEHKQKQNSSILCLPTEAFSWLNNYVLEPIKAIVRKDIHHPQELKLIVMPLHMGNISHWGLVCVDLQTLTVYFGDGLTLAPPAHLCDLVGRLVKLLNDMFPSINIFNSLAYRHLATSQHKRMHMPQQKLDGKTAGGGSCGMGVILLAQQIILEERVPPSHIPITWAFHESNYYRKKLMLYVLT